MNVAGIKPYKKWTKLGWAAFRVREPTGCHKRSGVHGDELARPLFIFIILIRRRLSFVCVHLRADDGGRLRRNARVLSR